MPRCTSHLVLTGRPRGLALPWPLWATMGWCSAPERGGTTAVCTLQGRGSPTSSSCCFCLCLAASWLAASKPLSFALCKSWQQERVVWREPAMLGWGSQAKILQARMPWGRGRQHPRCLQTAKLGCFLSLAARCGNTESRGPNKNVVSPWNA